MQAFLSERALKFHAKYQHEAGGKTGPASRLLSYLFVRAQYTWLCRSGI